MQPASPGVPTCPNCGGVLEETASGGLRCLSCALRAGIGSEQETVHDSTPEAFEDREGFGVYQIDRREDGGLYELGRGAMGVTYRATDTSLQRKAIKEAERAITLLPSEKDAVAGPTLEENLASVEVKVGDKNRAISRLQHLLKIPYANCLTPSLLRLHPQWDP